HDTTPTYSPVGATMPRVVRRASDLEEVRALTIEPVDYFIDNEELNSVRGWARRAAGREISRQSGELVSEAPTEGDTPRLVLFAEIINAARRFWKSRSPDEQESRRPLRR